MLDIEDTLSVDCTETLLALAGAVHAGHRKAQVWIALVKQAGANVPAVAAVHVLACEGAQEAAQGVLVATRKQSPGRR